MARHTDWEDELSRPDSFPGTAAAMGVALLIVAGVFLLPRIGYPPFWQVLCGTLGIALLLWLAAFFATVRHASLAWKIGTFGILFVVGGAVALTGHLLNTYRLRQDISTVAQIGFRPDGKPIFARDAKSRGPISRLFVTMVEEAVADREKFDAEAIKLGVNLLADPYSLSKNPYPLEHCSDFDGLRKLAADNVKRQIARIQAFADGVAATDVPKEFSDGIRESMARDANAKRLTRMGELQGTMVDAIQAKCNVLARKRWIPQYGQFGFSHAGDLAEFNASAQRHIKAVTEMQRFDAEETRRVARRQEKLRRALGF